MDGRKAWRDKLHSGNRGYSLIELVIVLAIIAVIMSTVFYSIVLVFSANAKSYANNIQRSIGDCKVTTMGKSKAYMELRRDDDGTVYTQMFVWESGATDFTKAKEQKVGTSRVDVGYTPKGGTETPLLAGDTIVICFDRSNGGFAEDEHGNIYTSLYVRGGNKRYKITLTELTGKSQVEAE